MKHRVYIKIEVAIEVDSENESKADREARDILYDLLPDKVWENTVDMDVVRIAKID